MTGAHIAGDIHRDRRPRVGPSTVRATSHRHRIGKRMPCATVRAMQPDSTRAGDTDRRPPSGPMMDTPPPRNRVAADEGPNRGTGAGPEGGSAHRPGKVTLPDARPEDAGIVCPPCVPRDCPPCLCPEDARKAARPAAHPETRAGLDRGRKQAHRGKGGKMCPPCVPRRDFRGIAETSMK